MKILNLKVTNFRGIRSVELSDLGDMVIIAGQNGSGKTCVFDAIRLIKSVYGGYQTNEWHQWMGEFQIEHSNRPDDYLAMFNDPSKELKISCDFTLHETEIRYLKSNAKDVLREVFAPDTNARGRYSVSNFGPQYQATEERISQQISLAEPLFLEELEADSIHGELTISVGELPTIKPSNVLPFIFSTFRPHEIGVIDYHGSQRHFGRELVRNVNFRLDEDTKKDRQHALYNYANKYSNIKSEMAASYVKEILSEKAGIKIEDQNSLTNTLKELFESFFPDKIFDGAKPTTDGRVEFPVRTADGLEHDLDELSSGEKEVLYGYLRIRNSAPKFSIVLLDEPELHLNPRLVRNLPRFYSKHLGTELNNQIWLVTHSDALLREVVGHSEYNVFHMVPSARLLDGKPQLLPLNVGAALETAVVDLVGDLAAYRPMGKVVVVEGGGDSEFDRTIISKLFPEFVDQVNLVSGSNKRRVRALRDLLESTQSISSLPFEIYAITDRDQDKIDDDNSHLRIFSWDVYHIENYFLEAKYISSVLTIHNKEMHENDVSEELRNIAEETKPNMVAHDFVSHVNNKLVGSINIGSDPGGEDIVSELWSSINGSKDRIDGVILDWREKNKLQMMHEQLSSQYQDALADGTWREKLRGRVILKKFASRWASGTPYHVFVNEIVFAMAQDGYQPAGMKKVLDKIVGAA